MTGDKPLTEEEINLLIEKSKTIKSAPSITHDLDLKIIQFLKDIYHQKHEGISSDQRVYVKGMDIINLFKRYGISNVRVHLGQLASKGIIESGLFKTQRMYRWFPKK